MTTRMFTTAVQPINDTYEDFYSKESEDGAVLSFFTISDRLSDKFKMAYDKDSGELDEEKFMEELPELGIYEDDGDRCYTIILPERHMLLSDLNNWVEKLNGKFDEDLELWTKCLVCKREMKLEDRWRPETPIAEHNEWKQGKPFCSQRCYRHYRGHDTGNLEGSQTEEAKKKREKMIENTISLEELKEKDQE